MASKKKQPEGIALLSMYNDDEEDDEMDDVEESEDDEPQQPQQQQQQPMLQDQENSNEDNYEEGEMGSSGLFRSGSEVTIVNATSQGTTPTAQATSLASERLEYIQPDVMNNIANESESAEPQEAVKMSEEEPKHVDPLDNFLPSPPKTKCPVELQEKINKFLYLKKAGRSFNTEVRNRKDYRNPDFLLHAVRYQDIDQTGSCFSTDVFNPHGYDPSDYYNEIGDYEADMKREMERKEQERKKSQKVEFVSGGNQPPIVVPAPKINVPLPGSSGVAASGTLPIGDNAAREGRPNKKSKWDKVDTGPTNPLASGLQDSSSKVAAQAALLSAANAGAGYMAFAQQRRREAEEKRSTEKKIDRRS